MLNFVLTFLLISGEKVRKKHYIYLEFLYSYSFSYTQNISLIIKRFNSGPLVLQRYFATAHRVASDKVVSAKGRSSCS